ncbi:ribonuclease H-like protein [Pholiota molesta]|nr:ribonuclease H-like protein [Pholiota molesta]
MQQWCPDRQTPEVTVYTDGSCENNGHEDARAGAGIWFGENDPRNQAIRIPELIEQSNNVGELIAILAAIEIVPTESKLNIFTDSQYAINNIHENGLRLEKRGWIDVANKNILQKIIASLRGRKGDTYFIKVKGHSGDKGNEEADKLWCNRPTKEGAAKDIADNIDLQIPEDYNVEGAEFIDLTQAELYRGIREMKEVALAPRRNTTIWLDIIRWASKDRWGIFPTDKLIWTSIRNPNIDKKIRAFLYQLIHGSLRIGPYWEKIPQYEFRALCPECHELESMEHIQTECQASGQETIWQLAQALLRKRGIDFDDLRIGDIAGATIPNFKLPGGNQNAPLNRLYKIIMTESLYLIWLLRCEWRIDREEDPEKIHKPDEIVSRWRHRINRRIKLDQAMATKSAYKWKKITKDLVRKTWAGTLKNENSTPEDWIWMKGVLVGEDTVLRPPGRNR